MILLALLGCERYPSPISAAPWQLLVADTGHGRAAAALRDDATPTGDVCLSDLLPDTCGGAGEDAGCLLFEVGHALDGGDDVFTFAFGQRGDANFPGGVAMVSLDGDGEPTVAWRTDLLTWPDDPARTAECAADTDTLRGCRLAMPHAHTWLPDGETLAVADTLNNRVAFLRPSPEGTTEVVALLAEDHPDNPSQWWPNALDLVEEDGRTLLLVTYKGSDPTVTGVPNAGRLMLWDVTDLQAPTLEWAWPTDGWLAAVHGGSVQDGPDGPLVVYAHARGDSEDPGEGDDGSVGVARWEDGAPPTYLGDLVLAEGDPLGFVRDVEVVDDGLLVTDSGCENQDADCGRPGRVITLALPTLDAPALGGGFSGDHADQAIVPTDVVGEVFTAPLSFPFEADLLAPEERGAFLSDRRPSCIASDE